MIGIGGASSPLDGKFDWLEKTETLKGLPMPIVQQVAINSGDPMMKTLAVGEIDRRAKMQRSQMAQMAQPNKTVAQMVVGQSLGIPQQQPQPGMAAPGQSMQAGIGALQGPQGAMPQQGPVGPPMEEGGPLTADALIRRMIESAQSARTPDMETMEGALSYIDRLMGPNRAAYEQEISDRRAQEPQIRNRELSDRLRAMGTALMTYGGPNGLTALGHGFDALNQEQHAVNAARDARTDRNIADRANLMGLDAQRLSSAGSLYGIGREGLAGLVNALQGGANILGQRDIARTYASRQAAGQPSARLTQANRRVAIAQTAVNNATNALARYEAGVPGQITTPEQAAEARTRLARAQQHLAELEAVADQLALVEFGGGDGAADEDSGGGGGNGGIGDAANSDPERPRGARERWSDYHRRHPDSARPEARATPSAAQRQSVPTTPEEELAAEQGTANPGWSVGRY